MPFIYHLDLRLHSTALVLPANVEVTGAARLYRAAPGGMMGYTAPLQTKLVRDELNVLINIEGVWLMPSSTNSNLKRRILWLRGVKKD